MGTVNIRKLAGMLCWLSLDTVRVRVAVTGAVCKLAFLAIVGGFSWLYSSLPTLLESGTVVRLPLPSSLRGDALEPDSAKWARKKALALLVHGG